MSELLSTLISPARAAEILAVVETRERGEAAGGLVPRAALAQALGLALFAGLLERVPTAAAYVAEVRAAGGRVVFDHGALRTVDLEGMGALPRGEAAITRVLVPLGYRLAGTYPLDRLGMTGRAYAQEDDPEALPQYFVSELHVARFSPGFQAAAARVTASSRDPLDEAAQARLARLAAERALPFAEAAALLPALVACFDRQHAPPRLADYETLLAESQEMGWIATEGNAFNHATDRVADLDALAAQERAKGRPLKAAIEVSRSGRVRQTAYRADPVERTFLDETGAAVRRTVPGSFYEFIERQPLPDGSGLDLAFDSANAQGIFKMTSAANQ